MPAAKGKPRGPARPAKKAAPSKAAKKASKAPKAKQAPRTKAKPAKAPARRPAPEPADVAEDSPAAWTMETTEAPHPAPAAAPASSAPGGKGWSTVPPARPAHSPRPFDPATGAWIPVEQVEQTAPAAAVAPDAPKKGTTGYILWTILLWVDLAVLAVSALASIVFGAILVFAPDSSSADWIRGRLEGGSASDLVVNTIIGFVSFAVIPVLWLLGTRREPVAGTKRFLHLHDPGKGILRGILLTIPLLVAVALLVTVYTLATEGADGLTGGEEPNPAVQAILDNLSWPIAFLVAICAGVGEEIFFRGFLQRYIGVWGQAVLFGLAHATGGYLPQILFALGLGILFGLLIKRGWSLWSLITAHFLYDFILLALALVAPELG